MDVDWRVMGEGGQFGILACQDGGECFNTFYGLSMLFTAFSNSLYFIFSLNIFYQVFLGGCQLRKVQMLTYVPGMG